VSQSLEKSNRREDAAGVSRKDPSIVDCRECEERVESQERRERGLKDQGPREDPAEIKRTACHTSAVVLIRDSPDVRSLPGDSLIDPIEQIGFTRARARARFGREMETRSETKFGKEWRSPRGRSRGDANRR